LSYIRSNRENQKSSGRIAQRYPHTKFHWNNPSSYETCLANGRWRTPRHCYSSPEQRWAKKVGNLNFLIEVASNDKNWVSYNAATWGDYNAKGFMILARSVCEIMAKKSKLGHLKKKSYGADFWFCQVTWPRGISSQSNGAIAPIVTKRACLMDSQMDRQTDRRWTAIWQKRTNIIQGFSVKLTVFDRLSNYFIIPFTIDGSWWCCGNTWRVKSWSGNTARSRAGKSGKGE
jgi:hypothetical protein